jgi:small-conductance mechanosensitive channel
MPTFFGGIHPHISVSKVVKTVAKVTTTSITITKKTVVPAVTAVAKGGEQVVDHTVVPAVTHTAKVGETIVVAPAKLAIVTVDKATNQKTIDKVKSAANSAVAALKNLQQQADKVPAEAAKLNVPIQHALDDMNKVLDDYTNIQIEIMKDDPEQAVITQLQNDAQNEINHVNADLKTVNQISNDVGIIEEIGDITGG